MIRVRLHTAEPESEDDHVADYPGYEDVTVTGRLPREGDLVTIDDDLFFPETRGVGSTVTHFSGSDGERFLSGPVVRPIVINAPNITPVLQGVVLVAP